MVETIVYIDFKKEINATEASRLIGLGLVPCDFTPNEPINPKYPRRYKITVTVEELVP